MEVNNNLSIQADNLNVMSKVFYVGLSLYYLLNLTAEPLLKFLFPVLLILAAISILTEKSFVLSLAPILAMIFITGQGKILWSYNPIFHISFDYLQLLFIFKVFYRRKNLVQVNIIPTMLLIPITLHMLWYFAQLFNVYNIGLFGTLAAGRIYVLPLIFFVALLNIPFEEEKRNFQILSKITLFSIFSLSVIALVQHNQGESFLINLAPYYKIVMGEAFVDNFFRPFSTTELPGAYTIYFTVTVALIFFSKLTSKLQFLAATFIVPLSIASSIISQVRSAYIKYFLILGLCSVIIVVSKKLSPMSLFKKIVPGSFVVILLASVTSNLFSSLDLQNALMRLFSIFNPRILGQTRSGPDVIFNVIVERLWENPIGLGPGRTGAAAGFSKENIINDPVYGLEYSWAYDNLFVSLATDLGLGMFIYIFIVMITLYYLLNHALSFFRNNDRQNFQILSVCFISCSILFLGNWGAIGLTYNPESFSFWLLSGIGLSLGFRERQKREINNA